MVVAVADVAVRANNMTLTLVVEGVSVVVLMVVLMSVVAVVTATFMVRLTIGVRVRGREGMVMSLVHTSMRVTALPAITRIALLMPIFTVMAELLPTLVLLLMVTVIMLTLVLMHAQMLLSMRAFMLTFVIFPAPAPTFMLLLPRTMLMRVHLSP